jgi:hypothetical protein
MTLAAISRQYSALARYSSSRLMERLYTMQGVGVMMLAAVRRAKPFKCLKVDARIAA